MEITSIHNEMYQNTQAVQKKEISTEQDVDSAKQSGVLPPSRDEYVKGSDEAEESSGIYRPALDEDGKRKILKDSPEAQNTTANTDKVDREIERLKQEKQQLEQQIRAASGDDGDTENLKRKLAAVERELMQKDNDAYRRQHSTFTTS